MRVGWFVLCQRRAEPSHVLAAMGVPQRLADGAVRFTLGSTTTDVDVDHALAVVPDVATSLRGCF